MLANSYIFIGLLSVLFFFKRTRYAASIYLTPYLFYLYCMGHGLIPDEYYHASSATFNLFIFVFLIKSYRPETIHDIFNWHKYNINEKVGLLSALLVVINFVGYCRYENGDLATIYNSDYLFIVSVQIGLLYIRNMIDAWNDRSADQRAMVHLNNSDNY